VDLAGFPKDAYYMYQSEWTDTPVLHLFPHWNWKDGEIVDVWVYTNCDEVELFLNGQSQGTKGKKGDDLYLAWRLSFTPGTLKAIGRTAGKETLVREVRTAGTPSTIVLTPDRQVIAADGKDLSFVTVSVLDDAGTIVPQADNLVTFTMRGEGRLAGVDNGLQTSHEPFKASYRKAFNGLCLAVIQSGKTAGQVTVTASSVGLKEHQVSSPHDRRGSGDFGSI
jgi:beta-galactosidase